jgi:hypothetical protein
VLYNVTHHTCYEYGEPVSLCHNSLHLRPRACRRQQCHQIELSVQPEPEQMHQHFDYFGNPVTVFTIQVPHELSITAESWVEVTAPEAPFVASSSAAPTAHSPSRSTSCRPRRR